MKKVFGAVLLCLVVLAFSACGTENQEFSVPVSSEHSSSEAMAPPSQEQSEPAESSGLSSTVETPSEVEDGGEPKSTSRQISVQFGENTVIYELNDGTAADSFYEQLPLTIEVADYSTNEKIFYPPQALDTADAPPAEGGAGTLAYYAPWGDVVMFYGDYNANGSLYELGEVVSGGELIAGMSGTVTIETAQ